jgi:hypothetical protein
MIDVPALPLLRRTLRRRLAARRPRPSPRAAWTSEGLHRIEVVAPDSACAALLLEYATPLFPAEVVSSSTLVVRLQPPAGPGWVIELLSLVDRWLESTRHPSATVLYGGRSYLIHAPLDLAQLVRPAAAATVTP